jgi:hypothetical protein
MRRRPFGRYFVRVAASHPSPPGDIEFPRNSRRKSTAARATSRRRPPEAHRAHAHRQIAHGRRKGATLPTESNRRFELRSSPSISSPEDPSKARRFAMAQACQPGEDAPPSYNRLAKIVHRSVSSSTSWPIVSAFAEGFWCEAWGWRIFGGKLARDEPGRAC